MFSLVCLCPVAGGSDNIHQSGSSSYSYSSAIAYCTSQRMVLATFAQLQIAAANGFDSQCLYGWVSQ